MLNNYFFKASFFVPVLISLLVFPMTATAAKTVDSTLTTDLQSLVVQGNELNTQISALSLSLENSCTDLGSTVAAVESLTASIESVSASLTSALTLDVDSLTALDDLSMVSANIASTLPVLSGDISVMSTNAEMADIDASLAAMLSLSDGIGTMADRILEMADKILVMADNIGEMADRIVLTQEIQSTNLALTQAAILSTQENMILLSVTVDTSAYNLPMSNLIDTGNVLSQDMNNASLTEANMNTQLADFENRVKQYLNDTALLSELINSDTQFSSAFINGDTLTLLGDLSVINASLASAINNYSQTINLLAANTDIAILNDAVYSMLRLAGDIGLMGNRMAEMGDNIIIMADNIGLMTLNIVETQTLQQSNLNLTQSNLSAAQINTVTAISVFGL